MLSKFVNGKKFESAFLFFFIVIQEEVAPKWYSLRGGPLYRENKKRFQGLGRSRRYLWMRILKGCRLYIAGKTDGGREFQSLEVIEINELANAFVRLVFNLNAYEW